MSARWRIVLLATLFNLAFEFAFRGTQGLFVRRGLLIGLSLIYVAYFTIVEFLIRRYRITNVQLLLVAFAFGLWPLTFLTGLVFAPPLALGVNWRVLLGVNIVWWGFTQGLLTLYFANRIARRNWSEPPVGRGGFGLAVAFLLLVHLGNFSRSTVLPRGPAVGYVVVLTLFFVTVGYLRWQLTRSERPPYDFERSRLLDGLAFGSLAVFVGLGLFGARNPTFDPSSSAVIDLASVAMAKAWTGFVFVAILAYYALYRRRITI